MRPTAPARLLLHRTHTEAGTEAKRKRQEDSQALKGVTDAVVVVTETGVITASAPEMSTAHVMEAGTMTLI